MDRSELSQALDGQSGDHALRRSIHVQCPLQFHSSQFQIGFGMPDRQFPGVRRLGCFLLGFLTESGGCRCHGNRHPEDSGELSQSSGHTSSPGQICAELTSVRSDSHGRRGGSGTGRRITCAAKSKATRRYYDRRMCNRYAVGDRFGGRQALGCPGRMNSGAAFQ